MSSSGGGTKREFSEGMMKALGNFFCIDCRIPRPLDQRTTYRGRYMCTKCKARKVSFNKKRPTDEHIRSGP